MLFGIIRRLVALAPRGIVRGRLLAGTGRGDAPPQNAPSRLDPRRLDRARQCVAILRIHHRRVPVLLHGASALGDLGRRLGRRPGDDLTTQDETRAPSGSLERVRIVNDSRGALPGLILAKLPRLLRRLEAIGLPLDARWRDAPVDLQRRRAVVALATLHVVDSSSFPGPRRAPARSVDVDALTHGDQTAAAVVPTILFADIHPK